jgi:hypothetical protein
MGHYSPTHMENSATLWCIENNISVCPLCAGYNRAEWYVEIIINGKSKKSPETYGNIKIWEKTYEYRLYYYNKFLNRSENE